MAKELYGKMCHIPEETKRKYLWIASAKSSRRCVPTLLHVQKLLSQMKKRSPCIGAERRWKIRFSWDLVFVDAKKSPLQAEASKWGEVHSELFLYLNHLISKIIARSIA
ncbi:TPA: hypothetical protein ACVG9G_004406 [Bacillus thuringiensis]